MFKNSKIHFIGIGGISMSGIALLILEDNTITGSDKVDSKLINDLRDKGVDITIGHNLDYIKNADIVVYTAAIEENDPELVLAKELNKTLYDRSTFLGLLTKDYKHNLCVAGTHGKSTTTGFLSLIFLEANLNPTIQIGAILKEINSNLRVGSKNYFIMEACEYVDSFLHFFPTSSIITNIDADHLNYFKTLDNIKKSFYKYSSLIPSDGYLVINNDDENSKELKNINTNIITYGIKNKSNYMAKNITYQSFGYPSYDVYKDNDFLIHIDLNILGEHNIYNSLAAIALSMEYIGDINIIKKGIEKFHGVERRFELKGKYNNTFIYDDYAHHPSEIKTTLSSTKSTPHNKNWAIFQAHTFTRVKRHLDEFVEALKGFDNIIVTPIFPARETNIYNVSEDQIITELKKVNNNVIYLDSFNKIKNYIKENVEDNDLVVTIGAGDIYKVAEDLVNN